MTQIDPLIIGSAKLVLPKIIKRGLYGLNHYQMPNNILRRNNYRVFLDYFYQPNAWLNDPIIGIDFIITGNIINAARCEQYCELNLKTQTVLTKSSIIRSKFYNKLVRQRRKNDLYLQDNGIFNDSELTAFKRIAIYLYQEDPDLNYTDSLACLLKVMSNYLLNFYLHKKEAEPNLPYLFP